MAEPGVVPAARGRPIVMAIVRRLSLRPRTWLLIAMASYFVVSFALSWLRAVEFQTTTWDQGLYQQAIWTTAHGRTFYEAADVETGGYGSLLDVHTVFLLFLVVPMYAMLPYQTTLFAVQSAVVALAAVPIYWLTKDLSRSSGWGLVGGLAYLAWAPTLSSTLYDFHPEAFLPVELFTLALLWERGQYRWGFLVAAVAFSTLELAPVLTFFVGVFGLLSVEGTAGPTGGFLARGWWRRLRTRLVPWVRQSRFQASVALMAASVIAYALLFYLRVDYLTSTLGTYPLPMSASGYVIGVTPAGLQLSVAYLGIGLSQKLAYWLVATALLAFVPLFAPRALVLSLPWFSFTMLSSDLNYTTMGFQYGFIAASSLLVAFAYGLPRARRWAVAVRDRWSRARPGPTSGSSRARAVRVRRVAGIVALVAFLSVNLAITPLNPAMDNHGMGSAYRLSYTPSAGDAGVVTLASFVPARATVVASDDLFPLVANDPNAYSFLWANDPALALPFNATHLPAFVLISQRNEAAVPSWISATVNDSSDYGVRGIVWSSDAGIVRLYAEGYTGPMTQFGAPPKSE